MVKIFIFKIKSVCCKQILTRNKLLRIKKTYLHFKKYAIAPIRNQKDIMQEITSIKLF